MGSEADTEAARVNAVDDNFDGSVSWEDFFGE